MDGGRLVCSEQFDHTSVLRFLEKFTGITEPNISQWRRDTFGDLTSAFQVFGPSAPPPVLPDTAGPLTYAEYTSTQLPAPTLPGANQTMPHQEPGFRPHRP